MEMEKTEQSSPQEAMEAKSVNPGITASRQPFEEFQRAVESRLEGAILERIRLFREELLKMKRGK